MNNSVSAPLLVVLIAVPVLVLVAAMLMRRGTPAAAVAGGEQGEEETRTPAAPVRAQERDPLDDPDTVVVVPLPGEDVAVLVLGSEAALASLAATGEPVPGGLFAPLVARVVGGRAAIATGHLVLPPPETAAQLRRRAPVQAPSATALALARGESANLRGVRRLERGGREGAVGAGATALAQTAALTRRLARLEQELALVPATLDRFLKDRDRHRLSDVASVNRALAALAASAEDRGEVTTADAGALAPLAARAASAAPRTAGLEELAARARPGLGRGARQELLGGLAGEEPLAAWLSSLTGSELALGRAELLRLHWDQAEEPGDAVAAGARVLRSFTAREAARREAGVVLAALTGPEPRGGLDPRHQRARMRLRREQRVIDAVLARHGDAFAPPQPG